jgi:CheY-like chemotaxis protein
MTTTVLLVSDIPDHIPHYKAALIAHGHAVSIAVSATEALQRAIEESPACVVIDERISEMKGWDLCKRLRADLRIRSIPVVMLVQNLRLGEGRETSRTGCNSWLAQPAAAEHLVHAVEHVLSRNEAQPRSDRDAILGVRSCAACQSDQTRPGVRIGAVQYYFCQSCGLYWEADSSPS